MKVKIIKAVSTSWYKNKVGKVFDVIECLDTMGDPTGKYRIVDDELRFIDKNDCKRFVYKDISTIEYLAKIRQQEIGANKNASTRNPLYIVYSIVKSYQEYDNNESDHIDMTTSLFYANDVIEVVDVTENEYKDNEGNVITEKDYYVGYHDSFETVCFTRESAERFIELNGHNMNEPYIYVHYGNTDRNRDLEIILKQLGDKR